MAFYLVRTPPRLVLSAVVVAVGFGLLAGCGNRVDDDPEWGERLSQELYDEMSSRCVPEFMTRPDIKSRKQQIECSDWFVRMRRKGRP